MRNRHGISSVFADDEALKANARPLRKLRTRPTAAGVEKAIQNDGRTLSKRRWYTKRRGTMAMAVTRASPSPFFSGWKMKNKSPSPRWHADSLLPGVLLLLKQKSENLKKKQIAVPVDVNLNPCKNRNDSNI